MLDVAAHPLPDVPFIDAGSGGAAAIFDAAPERAMRLLEWGEKRYGAAAMRSDTRASGSTGGQKRHGFEFAMRSRSLRLFSETQRKINFVTSGDLFWA